MLTNSTFDMHVVPVELLRPGTQLKLFCDHCLQPLTYVKGWYR